MKLTLYPQALRDPILQEQEQKQEKRSQLAQDHQHVSII